MVATLLAFAAGRHLLLRASGPSDSTGKPAATDGKDGHVDPFIVPPSNERRHALRRGGNAIEVDLLDPDGAQPSISGWVVNRSVGGLCIEVGRSVEAGSSLKVQIRNSPTVIEVVVVKCCRMVGSAWQINCQFISSPTFNELLMFG
jgi:hypothetical protein